MKLLPASHASDGGHEVVDDLVSCTLPLQHGDGADGRAEDVIDDEAVASLSSAVVSAPDVTRAAASLEQQVSLEAPSTGDMCSCCSELCSSAELLFASSS